LIEAHGIVEIRVYILLGIKVTVRFYFALLLTCSNRIGLRSAECSQINEKQHVFAGQSPCANTFKQA